MYTSKRKGCKSKPAGEVEQDLVVGAAPQSLALASAAVDGGERHGFPSGRVVADLGGCCVLLADRRVIEQALIVAIAEVPVIALHRDIVLRRYFLLVDRARVVIKPVAEPEFRSWVFLFSKRVQGHHSPITAIEALLYSYTVIAQHPLRTLVGECGL